MLAMLQDLVRHKGYANASLLRAIRQHEAAAQDLELRTLLHHIILANRFWLRLLRALPFAPEAELQVPESLEAVADQYRDTHAEELEWISHLGEPELARQVETAFIPGRSYSVAQALMQVRLHSHGHRAQCATRLRVLGAPRLSWISLSG